MFLFFIFVILVVTSGASHFAHVTKEKELEQILCHNSSSLDEDTHLVLSTDITHIIDNVSFCIINTTYSLTLTSHPSQKQAVINCSNNGSTMQPTTGFAFINIHNLSLHRLVWSGCGGFLSGSSSVLQIINSTESSVYFTQNQSAVLVIFGVDVLLIQNVNITSYHGFSILAINPLNALMDTLDIRSSLFMVAPAHKTRSSFGSGILLLFTDGLENESSETHTVTVNNTKINGNWEQVTVVECLTDLQYMSDKFPVVNAAGLTVLYTQKKFLSNVTIRHTHFSGNFESISGAILTLHYKTNKGKTMVYDCNLGHNNDIINGERCEKYGASLAFITIDIPSSFSNPLIIDRCKFTNDDFSVLKTGYNAVYIGVFEPTYNSNITVIVNNSIFVRNRISSFTTGACIYAKTYYSHENHQYKVLNIVLTNINASNNTLTNVRIANSRNAVFSIQNLAALRIGGVSNFYDNYGSVFKVIDTKIELSGNLTFLRNRAESGAAFNLNGNTHFYPEVPGNEYNVTFIDNVAVTKGGAIYANDDTSNLCIFQMLSNKTKMTFINNTAGKSGSSIYSNNMFQCDRSGSGQLQKTKQSLSLYNLTFTFVSSSHLHDISTPSFTLELCKTEKFHLSQIKSDKSLHIYTKPIYPGQTLMLPLCAKDLYRPNLIMDYAMVSFAIGLPIDAPSNTGPAWSISTNDANHALSNNNQCNIVNITLLKLHNKPNRRDDLLVISSVSTNSSVGVKLDKLSDCPIGFTLDLKIGKCVCLDFLNKIGIKPKDCWIFHSVFNIPRPPFAWIGPMTYNKSTLAYDNRTVIGAAETCSIFCNFDNSSRFSSDSVFVVNSTTVTVTDDDQKYPHKTHSLCLANREGLLCSQCSPGYSVVFGSDECKKCSNWWLLMIIVYTISGPILIYLLYALKLTLTTGTLNGIIFFVQVIGVFDLRPSPYTIASTLVKSIILLEPNFSLCFYDGMTEIMKSFFCALYPLYLISILLFLIVLSRFSVQLSNRISGSSIQVLVTVVHLSFSTLFLSIMDVFASINVYTNTNETQIVWFRDATKEYGKGSHLILMIITSLVVGPILGIYMTVLLAGRPLMRINYKIREYIRPVYEAIHAPYKRNREFFFVSRLAVVIFIYTLYVLSRGRNLLVSYATASPILTTYTALEGLARPFKRMSLNIFNFILLSLMSVLYGTEWYFIAKCQYIQLVLVTDVLYGIVTLFLTGVIILHLLWVTGLLDKLKIKCQGYWHHLSLEQYEETSHRTDNLSGSFFEPYDRVREPLLSPS